MAGQDVGLITNNRAVKCSLQALLTSSKRGTLAGMGTAPGWRQQAGRDDGKLSMPIAAEPWSHLECSVFWEDTVSD